MNTKKSPAGLYIHIPFCGGKCPYCDFYSVTPDFGLMAQYTDAIIRELAGQTQYHDRVFDTLYFGGGTPNLLGADNLGRIIKAVKQTVALENPEITLECNPASFSGSFFEEMAAAGVNRVSMGLQSACADELAFLGRKHTVEQVESAVTAAKKAGISNISLDIIAGLPEQDINTLAKTLTFAAGQEVTHISVYLLKVEEGTPFFERGVVTGEDVQEEHFLYLCERLASLGFEQYEISNFCKPGFESRHNLHYWQAEEYWGLGPSAHSFMDSKRFFYPPDVNAFIGKPAAVPDGEGGGAEEKAMLALRLCRGLRGEKAIPFLENAKKLPPDLVQLETDVPCIRLTTKGFLLSNTLIARILYG